MSSLLPRNATPLAPLVALVALVAATLASLALAAAACGSSPYGDASADDGGEAAAPSTGDATTADAQPGDGGPCAANLQSDPANCGRCGHDCIGGSCSAGMCQPVLLATSLGNPSGIALGPADVFFTAYSDGAVASVKKSGGAVTSLSTGEKLASGVAVSGSTVYWANGDFAFNDAGDAVGGIWQCTLPGCTARTYVAVGAFDTGQPTLKGGLLYFSTGEGNTVDRVPLDGGPQSTVSVAQRAFGIAVDDTHVYFTSPLAAVVRRASLVDGGAPPEDVGPAEGSAVGYIAVDDSRAYWAYTDAAGQGHVTSTDKALTGKHIVYGTPLENVGPVGIAVDAVNVYWSTQGTGGSVPVGDGKVFFCKKEGCGGAPPTVLATGNVGAGQLIVDDVAIYWAEYGTPKGSNGRIRKVAKP